MSLPTCNPCSEVPICWEDLEKYSLQDDLYPSIYVCPPNVYCGGPQTMYLACCDGTTMEQNFPQGITIARRNQLIAELVARCQRRLPFCEETPPPPGGGGEDEEYFYSAPASCTVYCPDGTPFTYTVPAGVFIASSVAIAQEAARRLACEMAPLYRICLGNFNACWCVGAYSSGTISIESSHPPFKVSQISGSFPAGVTLGVQGHQILIAGSPTTAGNYTFGLQVVDTFGNRIARTYSMSVLNITSTALPNYSVGTPYSFQLTASGGSGDYIWSLYAGTLPDGLTLTDSGLISGTPTGTGTTVTLVFQVVDRDCETNQNLIFIPRIKLTTAATTLLRIKRGYPVFSGTDTTLYKKITWSGYIIQRSTIPEGNVAGARYQYSGATEVDIYGNPITHHTKNLYVQCLESVYPVIGGFFSELTGTNDVTRLLGYCWPDDPNSCATCSSNENLWTLQGDYASGTQYDLPQQMLLNWNAFTTTPTTYDYFATKTDSFNSIEGVANMPGLVLVNGLVVAAPTITMTAEGNFGAVLSEPYTDANAIASQKTYTSSLATAENKPDYQVGAGNNFLRLRYSRYTTVNYTLTAYNLVVGRTYIMSYDLKDSNGTTTTQTLTFVATAQTYLYTGSVPTPAAGRSITIKNQKIRYA